jgi:hypothetical protein
MELVTIIKDKFCHEYRILGDIHSSYGFGDSEAEARAKSVYGSDQKGSTARDHPLGFGCWRIEIAEDGALFIDEAS